MTVQPTYRIVRKVEGVAKPLPVASGFPTEAAARVWIERHKLADVMVERLG